MTKDEFLKEVIKEVKTIKKKATKEELANLDINKFNPDNVYLCIYGMLTGDCNSFRARELYQKCLVDIDKKKNIEQLNIHSESGYFTLLEQYLISNPKNYHNIIPYLKGEEKQLKIKLKKEMKTETDTTYFPRKLSKKKALEYMSNNKGHFFTAVFVDKEGKDRKINCQYLKDQKQSPLGYVLVRECNKLRKGEDAIKSVNLQSLKELHIAGIKYKL